MTHHACPVCLGPTVRQFERGRIPCCSDECQRESKRRAKKRYRDKKRAELEARTGKPAPRPGDNMIAKARPAIDRVLEKCYEDANGCWVYTGPLAGLPGNQYGRTFTGSHRDGTARYRPSHQVTYEYFIADIPEGLEIDHFVCQNTICCNPWHLDPCTHQVNVSRQARCQKEAS